MDRIAPYVRYVNYKIFEGGTLLPERIIYDHELIYCLSGEAVFLYNGSEYRIRKGELFYLMPYLHNTMIVPEAKPSGRTVSILTGFLLKNSMISGRSRSICIWRIFRAQTVPPRRCIKSPIHSGEK